MSDGGVEAGSVDVYQDHDEDTWLLSIEDIIKILSQGAIGLLVSGHLTASSHLFISLGHEEAKAASMISTTQSLVMGAAAGLLYSTGLQVRNHESATREQKRQALKMAHLSLGWATVVGAASGVVLVFTSGMVLYAAPDAASQAVAQYLLTYALGTIPAVVFFAETQISFQYGCWWQPVLANVLYRVPAFLVSRQLALSTPAGAYGVGLGNMLVSWPNAILFYLFLRFQIGLGLPNFDFMGNRSRMWPLMRIGMKIASQRVSEWLNYLLILLLLRSDSDQHLIALNPGLQVSGIVTTFSQGVAAAVGMMIVNGRQGLGLPDAKRQEIVAQNGVIARNGVIVGGMLNLLFAGTLYGLRHTIVDIFMPEHVSQETVSLAESSILLIAGNFIADSWRIISSGALRPWEKILFVTVVSCGLMNIIGVPTGYGVGHADGDVLLTVFGVRALMSLVSGIVNTLELRRLLQSDNETNQQIVSPTGLGSDASESSRAESNRVVIASVYSADIG